MSIRPIDFKTPLYNSEDMGKVADNQKTHGEGVDAHIATNREENAQKSETVQTTEKSEGQKIKPEDENKKGSSQEQESGKKEKSDETEETKSHPNIPDGIHRIIDFRA